MILRTIGSTLAVVPFVMVLMDTARADQAADSGFYLSVGAGQNWIQSGPRDESTTPLKVAAGWQFGSNFGVELSYNDFGKFPGPTRAYEDFDLTGITAVAVGQLPLTNNIALLAKIGQIWWNADASYFFFGRNTGINETGTLHFNESDTLVGVGISFELTQQLELDLDYEYYEFEFSDWSSFNTENSAVVLTLKYEL